VPGVGIYDVFGLTETSTSDFILGPHARQDEVGRRISDSGVRFRLTTVDGSVVVDGEPGELEILTPFRMRGYLRRVDLTEKSFSEDTFERAMSHGDARTGHSRYLGDQRDHCAWRRENFSS
jgi:non-ribosomal peptide synthetase component F